MDPLKQLPFEAWLVALDAAVIGRAGLSVYDLPDQDFWSLYDEFKGDPDGAASQVLEDEGFPSDGGDE